MTTMTMNMNKMDQMELALVGHPDFGVPVRSAQRQRRRAQWWFAQMRLVVDRALDWQPAPPPRPEQTWFSSTQRQASM
jgi:hypothetical protein